MQLLNFCSQILSEKEAVEVFSVSVGVLFKSDLTIELPLKILQDATFLLKLGHFV